MEFEIGIAEIGIVATCVVTAFMTLATWRIAKANQHMIKASETPKVIAFLDLNPEPIDKWKYDIVLINIGLGPARDVFCKFDPGDNDLSSNSMIEAQPAIHMLDAQDDPFFEWIPQGHKIVLGNIFQEKNNLLSPCSVSVKYSNIRGQDTKEESYSLDLTNKRGIGAARGWRRDYV